MLEALAQGLSGQQLGDQKRRVAFAADIEDGQHVGVVERRRRARFLLEALQPRRVGHALWWQRLERDLTAEARVAGPEHDAHAA